MRSRSYIPAVFCALGVLAIALAGMMSLAGLIPFISAEQVHSQTVVLLILLSAGAGILVLLFTGAKAIRSTASQRYQVDTELLDAFLEHIPDNIFFKDRESRFIRISQAMARYCGLAKTSDAIGKTDSDIFSSEHAGEAFADEQEIVRTGKPLLEKEEKETWPDGHETWVMTTKVPIKNRSGEIVGTMGISHNITDRKQAEMRVRYMTRHDLLTGLPNRAHLEEQLAQAITRAERMHQRLAVLMLNLNHFKNVNDTLGHRSGDHLLEAVAERLKSCLREKDMVARVGGNEFAIVMPVAGEIEEVGRFAQKLLGRLFDPFEIDGQEVQITGSIGISHFPEAGENSETLLECAESAMYEAKRRGRGNFCFFSRALTQVARRQQRIENDLQQACARDEFVLHYMPIVATESGSMTGVEALLRWRHPELGMISPNQFIPQLEELGLMVGVGNWVLRTACRQNVMWRQEGFPPMRVAVNVSPQQFYHGNIVDTVRAVIRETGMDPKLLELELTENRTLDDSAATIKIMEDLKRIGVTLSLDDFGTGMSSLSYLRRFPLDRIKIDRSFVRDLPAQPAAEAVVKSILGLARNLGISCIAEGVETRSQREYLKKSMCAEIQGFLFSQPLPAAEFSARLRAINQTSSTDAIQRRGLWPTQDLVAVKH